MDPSLVCITSETGNHTSQKADLSFIVTRGAGVLSMKLLEGMKHPETTVGYPIPTQTPPIAD